MTNKDILSSLISRKITTNDGMRKGTEDLVTSYSQAIDELQRRRQDPELWKHVEEYLGGDIPEYFKGDPVLYLCRHVASPNIQTLRFLNVIKTKGMKTVIGQDSKDIFVSQNQLKIALGKLPICTGIFQKKGKLVEQFQKISIIDINSAGGKPFENIRTKWGQPLVEFHNELFKKFLKEPVHIENDSLWVDRYERGDLLAEYKKFLALFLVHGIMFEDYPINESESEAEFVTDILRPASEYILKEFGLRPLISPLIPMNVVSTEVWEGYPKEVLEVVKDKMKNVI